MLTTKQAAKILGVTQNCVNQLCAKGKLKAEKFANAWAVDEQSVQDRLHDENVAKYRGKHDNNE